MLRMTDQLFIHNLYIFVVDELLLREAWFGGGLIVVLMYYGVGAYSTPWNMHWFLIILG